MYGGLNERVFWLINGAHAAALDPVMYVFTLTAYSVPAALIALAAMKWYGGLDRRGVALLAAAMLLGGGMLHGVKQNVDADRPLAYFSKHTPPPGARVHAPYENHSYHSFPSGHTQTAFTVAVLLCLVFRRYYGWWLGWAALVGISRVYLGVHFPLDALAGAIIGSSAAAAAYFFFRYKGWGGEPKRKSVWFAWE